MIITRLLVSVLGSIAITCGITWLVFRPEAYPVGQDQHLIDRLSAAPLLLFMSFAAGIAILCVFRLKDILKDMKDAKTVPHNISEQPNT